MGYGVQIFLFGVAALVGFVVKVSADCDFDEEKLDMLPWNISPEQLWMYQTWSILSLSCIAIGATMSAAGY